MPLKFWLAVAAYVLPTFPLGYIWHLKAFKGDYESLEVYRKDLVIPLGLASMIAQGGAYAWLYPRLFGTAHDGWAAGALQFGLVFGLIAWTYSTLAVAAKHRMNSPARFFRLETAFTAIHFAIVSPLIAIAWRDSM